MSSDVDLWRRAKPIFTAALEIMREERPALIETACGHDEALKRAVWDLLASHEGDAFLDRPLLDPSVALELVPSPEESIGPYRLLRLIGEGGTSSVFLAERVSSDFAQTVAIKLIRDGRVGSATLRRFRRERRILAGLQHPHIARLLDGGTTEGGAPYVVMEYVEGVPMTHYCDVRRLTVRRRLELFRAVCEAVQYAHASLVIHRDIKPTNILVTQDGVPKLLDFGIATHLLPRRLDATDERTSTRERALTPEYASPEQLAGAPLTIATDVYSLGVLLHELLVGRRPLRQDPHPDPPSATLASRAETLTMAATRAVKPRELRRQVAGDLDNIVLRALRTEPSERYTSVEQFSADVARHLMGRPVMARALSFGYRARKFVRRNALAVALGSSAALSVAAVGTVVVHEGARVRRERDAALQEKQRAEQAMRFLVETFGEADPYRAGRSLSTVRELLDRGAQRIAALAGTDPVLHATVLSTIGNIYTNLGAYDTAGPLLEEALALRRRAHGEASREVAATLIHLGRLQHIRGDYPAAETSFRRAMALRRARLGDDNVEVGECLAELANLLRERGDCEAAEPLAREALRVLRKHQEPGHLDVPNVQWRLGAVLQCRGKLDEAESMYRQVLDSIVGGGHLDNPLAAHTLARLGGILEEKGHFVEAEPLYRQALETRRRAYGDRHPLVGATLNDLAGLLTIRGDYVAAERYQRQALALCRSVFQPDHPSCAIALSTLAQILRQRGDLAAAEGMARESLAAVRRALDTDHPRATTPLHVIGAVLLDQRRFSAAVPFVEEALTIERRKSGERHWKVGYHLVLLADIKRSLRRPREAAALAFEAVEILSREPSSQWRTTAARGVLGDCLVALGRLDEAQPLILESAAAARAAEVNGGYRTRRALERLARYEAARGRLVRAARQPTQTPD